jgi:tetratricopeptide (TPR) repeat protein
VRTGVLAIAWIGSVLHAAGAGPLRHKPSTAAYPSDALALFAKAVVFEREGRPGDAKASYYDSAERSPQANTYYDIAMMWIAIGSHHDGVEALKKYLELSPKAADRAEVEKVIAELEHRLPAVFVGARDFASSEPGSVVVLDGQVVGPAPLAIHPTLGRHVIERIGPTLYAREERLIEAGRDDEEVEPEAAPSAGNVIMDGLAPFEMPIVWKENGVTFAAQQRFTLPIGHYKTFGREHPNDSHVLCKPIEFDVRSTTELTRVHVEIPIEAPSSGVACYSPSRVVVNEPLRGKP